MHRDRASLRHRKFRAQVFTIRNEKPELDFDKIIPAPPILRELEDSTIDEAAAALIIARVDRSQSSSEMRISVTDSKTKIKHVREEMNMPKGSIAALATAYFAKFPESEAQGRLWLLANLETGYSDLYDWLGENWGMLEERL